MELKLTLRSSSSISAFYMIHYCATITRQTALPFQELEAKKVGNEEDMHSQVA